MVGVLCWSLQMAIANVILMHLYIVLEYFLLKLLLNKFGYVLTAQLTKLKSCLQEELFG